MPFGPAFRSTPAFPLNTSRADDDGGQLSLLATFGDLHARAGDEWLGVERLKTQLCEFEGLIDREVDLVFLPGDNANEGEPEQYEQIAQAFAAHSAPAPLHMVVTSPADHRLQVRPTPLDAEGRLTVRAKVFGARGDAEVTLHALDTVIAMAPVVGETAMWSTTLPDPWRETLAGREPPNRRVTLTVRAETADGVGEDTIRLGHKIPSPPVGRAGAAGGSIGAWPEHGLLGTRLGPNAYGKDW